MSINQMIGTLRIVVPRYERMVAIFYFNEPEDIPRKKQVKKQEEPDRPRTPADDFHDQVEALYKLPAIVSPRSEIRFSPSMVTKCARELYFINTNAPVDQNQLIVPWKQRLPRNGEGCHIVTQSDYLDMHKKFEKAGIDCKFKMIKTEVIGRKEYTIDGVTVNLSGRCDGILEDQEGTRYIWEKKTKDKLKNLRKIKEPQIDHKAQVVCYSLIFGIPKTIFEFESLQKPDWSKNDEEDMRHFYFESTKEMEEKLLCHLAGIVEAIIEGVPPDPEHDKCTFCVYKDYCQGAG